MRKLFMLLLCLIIGQYAITLKAQDQSQKAKTITDFEWLVDRIKTDYPGYQDKVTDENVLELKKLELELRQSIENESDSSYYYYSRYTKWFKDNHLRVRMLSQKTMRPKSQEGQVRFFDDMKNSFCQSDEAIIGDWVGFYGEFRIQAIDSGYIGFALQESNRFNKGQVFLEITKKDSLYYNALGYYDYLKFRPKELTLTLHQEERVLEIHGDTRLVRKTSNAIEDKALLYSYAAKHPNGLNTHPVSTYLSDSTYYMRIPGFYSPYAEEFVNKYWDDISVRPNLIIDIRNNGGGQDNYYQPLSKLIFSSPYESKGVEWYASSGNIEIFEEALEQGTLKNGDEGIKWTQALLKEMKRNQGGFVIHPLMGHNEVVTKDTIYEYPKRVGIIINENNASSAEQFLLEARNSSKVTIFGNMNTAGVLDYSNAVSVDFPSGLFELVCPMTRSSRLPEHPIDNIGISPDVIIPILPTIQLYDRLDDWVYYVKKYLELLADSK